MISTAVIENIEKCRAAFTSAVPFRHVVIDDFLETESAELLLRDFPTFDHEKAIDDMGEVGRKAVHQKLAEISGFYGKFSRYVTSKDFLGTISKMTGIENLLEDEKQYGGGTHENLQWQELDPHVDFNYDQERWLHRRLNLLLYLNKDWEESWGGSIELHSNPRRPQENQVKAFLPIFNRCLIFETNEYSWHGFPMIQLPPDKQHLSRKSVSIYLYTKQRSPEEIAPPHGTFYVQRPLSKHITVGHTISEADERYVQQALVSRDGWIEHYQNQELANGRLLKETRDYIAELESSLRVPVIGYALQQGPTRGYWPDGCVAKDLEIQLRVEKDITRIQLTGYVPDVYPARNEIRIQANEFSGTYFIDNHGEFVLDLDLTIAKGSILELSIHATETMSGVRAGVNPDTREGAFLLGHLSFG